MNERINERVWEDQMNFFFHSKNICQVGSKKYDPILYRTSKKEKCNNNYRTIKKREKINRFNDCHFNHQVLDNLVAILIMFFFRYHHHRIRLVDGYH